MKDAYLLSMKIAGIKNIEKPVELKFYKKTIDKNFDPKDYRVKSIYGGNGTGKTGLITAIDILKRIVLDKTYLSDSKNQIFLGEIINKKTRNLSIECEVLIIMDSDYFVVKYEISLKLGKDSLYEVYFEKMSYKHSNYPNNNYKTLYTSENGSLKDLEWSEYRDYYIEKTLNLLINQSFISNYLDFIIDEKTDKTYQLGLFANFLMIASNIRVYLQEEDRHNAYTFRKLFELYSDNKGKHVKETSKAIKVLRKGIKHPLNISSNFVLKTEFKEYQRQIKALEKFLKIFKSNLIKLRIEKKEAEDYYNTRIVLQYKDYDIDEEFESTGIRKLISLFECFNYSNKGGIVFIDEMDANINDVYYCKIIEYFMHYGKGQLIFTTHNLDSMNLLKENKLSIDFLSSINTLHNWKKNGNFAPDSLYKNGMIEDIPFNVDATDFIGIFEED